MSTKAIAAAAGFALLALCGCTSTMNQQWHRNCTIEHKDILYSSTDGNATRTKRLSTSCGDFKVDDSIAGGWNSWSRWNSFKEGQAYDIKTGGYRVGFFDSFPVVLEVKPR